MHRHYDDLLGLTDAKPSFFQEGGVPRWSAFSPRTCAGVYAREAAIVEIACQSCDRRFHVLMERKGHSSHPPLASLVAGGGEQLGYGDPPNVDCCLAGASMTSEAVRVVEFWERHSTVDWVRRPDLEVAFRRFGDPWSDEMRAKAQSIVDAGEEDSETIASLRQALADDEAARAAPADRAEPASATAYRSESDPSG